MKPLIHILCAAALVAVVPQSSVASSVRSLSITANAPLARAAQGAAGDALAAKVKSQITAEPEFAGSEVEVANAAGVVTLEGVVPNAVVRLKIVEKTKATEGVTRVVNKIKIAKAKK